MTGGIAGKLAALKSSRFRAKFHLGAEERAMVEQKGLAKIRQHAADLLDKRLFVAEPARDGRQTPWRSHPVFIAQHATGTCCRSCLLRWHQIPKGVELNAEQRDYVLDVIDTWIARDLQTKTAR